MARRSDHTREELKTMAILAGRNMIVHEGFSKLSARKVAKEIGYTVGTIYNIFESHEAFILHINATTLDSMYDYISADCAYRPCSVDTLKHLAASYIDFAQKNYHSWSALFEFNLPQDIFLPEWYADKIKKLFRLVEQFLLPLLDGNTQQSQHATKVLWAAIHGICQLGLTGKLDIIGAAPVKVLAASLIDNYIRGIQSEAHSS